MTIGHDSAPHDNTEHEHPGQLAWWPVVFLLGGLIWFGIFKMVGVL